MVGLSGPATEFALKPSSPTGHFQRRLGRCLVLMGELDEAAYHVEVPGEDRLSHAAELHRIPALNPHECLPEEIEAAPGVAGRLENAKQKQ